MKKIRFLTVQEVIKLHDIAVERFGGALGIRNKGLLESAIAQPKLVIFEKYVYKDLFQMAGAYAFHIIKNHAFIDGNKRTGILVALTFLDMNNYCIETDPESLYELAIIIAQSKLSKNQIAEFFRKNVTGNLGRGPDE